jgi:DNA-binding response OmpR family regulator
MAKIISVGYLRDMLERRTVELEAAAHEVFTADNFVDAMDLVSSQPAQIGIFGYAIPNKDRNTLAAKLRSCSPDVKIIFLYDSKITEAKLADAVVSVGLFGRGLIETVNDLLQLTDGHAQSSSRRA